MLEKSVQKRVQNHSWTFSKVGNFSNLADEHRKDWRVLQARSRNCRSRPLIRRYLGRKTKVRKRVAIILKVSRTSPTREVKTRLSRCNTKSSSTKTRTTFPASKETCCMDSWPKNWLGMVTLIWIVFFNHLVVIYNMARVGSTIWFCSKILVTSNIDSFVSDGVCTHHTVQRAIYTRKHFQVCGSSRIGSLKSSASSQVMFHVSHCCLTSRLFHFHLDSTHPLYYFFRTTVILAIHALEDGLVDWLNKVLSISSLLFPNHRNALHILSAPLWFKVGLSKSFHQTIVADMLYLSATETHQRLANSVTIYLAPSSW